MAASPKRTPVTFAKPRPRASRTRAISLDDSNDSGIFSVVAQIKRYRTPMSVAELAPILGVSDDVLYRMVREGKVPQLIVPGRRVTRFDPASIVYWLCKHNPLLHQVQKAS